MSSSTLESKKTKHFIIKLLQQQLNELNRECQESQKIMRIELKKIFESQRNSPNNQIFTQKFEELFADYSMTINGTGFSYIAKIKSYLASSPVIKGGEDLDMIDDDDMENHSYNQCDDTFLFLDQTDLKQHQHNKHEDEDEDEEGDDDDDDKDEEEEREMIITRSRSKSRLRNNDNKQSKCKYCDKIFSSTQALGGHIKVHNKSKAKTKLASVTKNDGVFECHICHKIFKSSKSLAGHKGGAHKDYFANYSFAKDIYACKYDKHCHKSYSRKSDLYSHIREHHHGSPFACEIEDCDEVFKFHREWKHHINNNHNNNSSLGPKTQKQSDTDTGDEDFVVDTDTGDEDYNAEVSESEYDDQDNDFRCNECGKTLTSEKGLKQHELLHFGDKNFICPHCGKSFVLEIRWSQHLTNVENENPFKCYECDKGFKNKTDLKIHRDEHNMGLKSASDFKKCKKCDERLTEHEVAKHMQWVHGQQMTFNMIDNDDNDSKEQEMIMMQSKNIDDEDDYAMDELSSIKFCNQRKRTRNAIGIEDIDYEDGPANKIQKIDNELCVVCGTRERENTIMMQCSECNQLYHCQCVGLLKETALNLTSYKCSECRKIK